LDQELINNRFPMIP
jgi:asparagine N-glycosylation enzyme membrane subunit Stt3